MSFLYCRTVRFRDTDAAGVVYFANGLVMCHEAYEASLASAGIDLKTFFGHAAVAIPIVHTSIDFFQPMFCGDLLSIRLAAQKLSEHQFQTNYQVFSADDCLMARAIAKHVCIDPALRSRVKLPAEMCHWLELTKHEE